MAISHLHVTPDPTERRSAALLPGRSRTKLAPIPQCLPWLLSVAIVSSCGLGSHKDSVVLLGDSITVLAGERIAENASKNFDVAPRADWGVRIDEEMDTAAEIAAEVPDQVFINLGTNNVLQRYDNVASDSDLESIVSEFDGVRCIHLVTVNEQVVRAGDESYSLYAVALNEKMRSIAESRDDVDIVDWNSIVSEEGVEAMLDADLVHPTDAGVEKLSSSYLDAMKGC